jgi:hypothetical protein
MNPQRPGPLAPISDGDDAFEFLAGRAGTPPTDPFVISQRRGVLTFNRAVAMDSCRGDARGSHLARRSSTAAFAHPAARIWIRCGRVAGS